jgi:hypothetical protein
MRPIALVVSNYPILSSGIRRRLQDDYDVTDLRWEEASANIRDDAALIVLDVTAIPAETALSFVAGLRTRVRIMVSSLDRNEVDVYLAGPGGLIPQEGLPSLTSLTA